VLEKVDFYLRAGVKLVWIVDPELETLTAYSPGAPHSVHRAPEVINAAPALPEFRLDLAALFAPLHDLDD
jgi:Uma2 family endonuclease